jgi:KaiC/GvpD/RAD55 family RecA-like ATPase
VVEVVAEYIPSGIPGLKKILADKGLPKGQTILVSGGPGSGKTTLGLQFLYKGATEYGDPGVYVTLDEDLHDIRTNMTAFGWDLQRIEDENLLRLIDVSPVRVNLAQGGIIPLMDQLFRLNELLDAIKASVQEIAAKRIVIDPITMFGLQYPDETERIYAMRDLMKALRTTACTCLMISELKGTGMEREHAFEEYLAHGVVLLRTYLSGNTLIRVFQVAKMRGLNIDTQFRPYEITVDGIEVHPLANVIM